MERHIAPESLLYEGHEEYIFISYSHKDEEVVLPMIEFLLWRGFRTWYDLGIPHGSNWDDVVADHLGNASVMIACLSKGFVDSLYCCNEIRTAIQKRIPILMLFLEDENSFKLPSGIEMNTVSNNRIHRKKYLTEERFLDMLYKEQLLQPCHQEIAPDMVPENTVDQFNLQKIVKNRLGESAKHFLCNSIMCSIPLALILLCTDHMRAHIPLQLSIGKAADIHKLFEQIVILRAEMTGEMSTASIEGSKIAVGLLGAITTSFFSAGSIVLFKYSCSSFYSRKNKWHMRYRYDWYLSLLVLVSCVGGVLFYPEVLFSLWTFAPFLLLGLLISFVFRKIKGK